MVRDEWRELAPSRRVLRIEAKAIDKFARVAFLTYRNERHDMSKRLRSRRKEGTDPSPKTIRQRSAAIRGNWSDKQRARRAGIKKHGWTPPHVHRDDLFDVHGSGESEVAG